MTQVLFVTAECAPFVKTGGLGDIAASLPPAVSTCEMRVAMPYYECLNTMDVEPALERSFTVPFEGADREVKVFTATNAHVTYYFFDAPPFFEGPRPYSSDVVADNRKFAFFAHAVIAYLAVSGYRPDVVHLNDWHTGALAAMLHYLRRDNYEYANLHTVFTIHNLRYQGICPRGPVQAATGLPDEVFVSGGMAWHDGLANPMKCALTYADRITTVSARYAEEIQTPEHGEGLHDLLYARRACLHGLVNGLDYNEFSPDSDRFLPYHYNPQHVKLGKALHKTLLQQQLGLKIDPDAMVLGVVSRMTEQKGIDLIAQTAERLLAGNTQLIITGDGEPYYEQLMHDLEHRWPGKVAAVIQFNEPFSRTVYAGADLLLMPSRFEPCGLSQMISMRYGTVPLVRRTGGLRDTVPPYTGDDGLGFTFEEFAPQALTDAFAAAENLFLNDRPAWDALVQRGMHQDFSWTHSAVRYADLYHELSGK